MGDDPLLKKHCFLRTEVLKLECAQRWPEKCLKMQSVSQLWRCLFSVGCIFIKWTMTLWCSWSMRNPDLMGIGGNEQWKALLTGYEACKALVTYVTYSLQTQDHSSAGHTSLGFEKSKSVFAFSCCEALAKGTPHPSHTTLLSPFEDCCLVFCITGCFRYVGLG